MQAPTLQSLKKEIDLLKKDNHIIKKKLASLGEDLPAQKEVTHKKQGSPISAGGIILIVIGGLWYWIGGGFLIGLALVICGIVVIAKGSKATDGRIVKPKRAKGRIKDKEKVKPRPKKKQVSFEEDVGMKWFARIGILALVIGICFFIKYLIDMDWINHLTRIIMGVVFGLALIIFGEVIARKEKYVNWAKTLVGGGFAITYFIIYAAYHFQEYRTAIGISQTLDIILLSLVVIFAIIFSLKDNSQVIAAESFFLAYITSLLSNTFELITIVYGLLLTVGLVIVVAYKKWSVIGMGGVVASYIMYFLWNTNNPNSFIYSTFILISYFLAFTIQSYFLLRKKEILGQNISITLINSALFFILFYFQIEKYHPGYTGLFALVFSVFYFIGYYIFQNLREEKFATTQLYLALLYITLTIPIQINKEWITIIWALETLILTMMFLKTKLNTLKISSYIVGAITTIKTLFYDTTLNKLDLANIINSTRLFSFLVTVICFYIVYKLLRNNKRLSLKDESDISLIYSWIAFCFLVIIIFLELAENHSVWISIILAILALVYNLIYNGLKEIHHQSIVISAILFIKIIIYDSWNLSDFNGNDLFSSTRFFAFIIAISVFYIISWYLESKKNRLNKSEFILTDIYSYAGTILAFVLIMIEMKEFWISIGWSILALIIMMSGFALRKKHLRMQGMIIFAITIFKVFVYDTRSLETIYRTVSYIVLGVILLLVSFIYTKYKEKLKDIL